MNAAAAPSPVPSPLPLRPEECAQLAALLARAIAHEQLALESEDYGLSCTNPGWRAEASAIDYEDDTAPRPGVHLRVADADLDYLTFAEEGADLSQSS